MRPSVFGVLLLLSSVDNGPPLQRRDRVAGRARVFSVVAAAFAVDIAADVAADVAADIAADVAADIAAVISVGDGG
jgi:hypothetical protein